jgi:hypothetical protein
MLTGGEFVLKKNIVDKYGVGFLDELNKGRVRGYAQGGYVGTTGIPMASQQNGEGGQKFLDMFTRMISLFEEIRDGLKNRAEVPAVNRQGEVSSERNVSGVTNNVTIQINVDKNRGSTNSSSETSSTDGPEQLTKTRQFAEMLEAMVLKVIVDQLRPHGLLAKS